MPQQYSRTVMNTGRYGPFASCPSVLCAAIRADVRPFRQANRLYTPSVAQAGCAMECDGLKMTRQKVLDPNSLQHTIHTMRATREITSTMPFLHLGQRVPSSSSRPTQSPDFGDSHAFSRSHLPPWPCQQPRAWTCCPLHSSTSVTMTRFR